jgi:hypothetical protein
MINIAQGLHFAQNLFNIVGRQQSDLFDGVESLFQFMSRLDDLTVSTFTLLGVSMIPDILAQRTKNSTSSKSSLYLDLMVVDCIERASL